MEIENKSNLTNQLIELDGILFDLPYNVNDINIESKSFENKTEFTLKNKYTGEILAVFGSETLNIEENIYFEKTKSIGTRASKNLYYNFHAGPCSVRLNQPITISTSGSFRWISGAGKATLNQVNGGDWKLSGTSLQNNWKGSDLSAIKVDAMTTFTVNTSSVITGSFSKASLAKAGFKVQLSSSQSGVNYYIARFTPTARFGFTWDVQSQKYTVMGVKK
ncbi:hypothetical protein [Romboutsia lituseburensis]|uniref:hypothetical protein n=1 Tax=Romboutsia lituseburensis TaxID=1537 RepID=UPI00215AB8C1|nr:hypothetical protein [Romboutsia lituseburensis]MCR8747248.1 hypothetical protein [Romboutsia lituseburensis]